MVYHDTKSQPDLNKEADVVMKDEEIIRRVIAGNEDLYSLIVRKYNQRPASNFNKLLANKGKAIFLSKAKCASCHALPILADNKHHTAAELGIDNFEAMRSPTGKYRTTPLGGLFARTKGGFYHDGQFATLSDLINHYNNHFALNLTTSEKKELEEYLKSL